MRVHHGRSVILTLCLFVPFFSVGHESKIMGQSRSRSATVRSNGITTPGPSQRKNPFYSNIETQESDPAPVNPENSVLSMPETFDEMAIDDGGRVVREKTPLPSELFPEDAETGSQTDSADENHTNRRSGLSSSLLWAAAILAVGWVTKRYFTSGAAAISGAPTQIELLSRQSIGPQQQLVLVRLGQRIILVGTTPSGMSTLAIVDDPAEVQTFLDELQPPHSPKTGSKVLDVLQMIRTKSDRENSAPQPVRVSTSAWNTPGERAAGSPRAEGVTDV